MKKIITLLLFIFLYHISFSQVWTKKSAVYTGKGGRGTTAFSIPSLGAGYAIGCSPNVFETWEYDKPTDTWKQRKNFIGSADGTEVGFCINGIGYMGSGVSWGCNTYNTFYKYDPVADVWTQLPNVPGPVRGYATGFTVGGKGYIGGGVLACSSVSYNDFYAYDPVTNKWDTIAPCPAKGCGQLAVGFSIGNYGYIGTGDTLINGSGTPAKDFWQYDPSVNKWTRKADFPGSPRGGASGFATCNKGYIGLGQGGPNQSVYYRDFYQYDPIKDSWKQIASFGGGSRTVAPSFVIGKSCFVALGVDSANNTKNDIWEYTFEPGFTADTITCTGTPVAFKDTSNYSPTSWLWSFPGGTPNTSTDSNPVVKYDTAGRFDVTLTAFNGCDSATKTFSKYITVNPGGAFSVSANPASICSGQSSTLTASGTSTYTWVPTNAINNSATGSTIMVSPTATTTYLVTSSGGSCGSTDTLILQVGNHTIGGLVTALRDTICKGTTGSLTLINNSDSTIQWQSSNDDASFSDISGQAKTNYKTLPLQQTTWYRATVGTGNCSAFSDTLQLYVPPILTANFFSIQTGNQWNFNSDSSKGNIKSYHWDFGDGTTSNDSNPVHTYSNLDTTHYVCLTLYDGSNCSYTYCRYLLLGVPTVSAEGNWLIYPDPFTSQLTISAKHTNNKIQSIELYDVLGRVVINKTLRQAQGDQVGTTNSNLQLDVSTLAKGMYYLMIRTADADYVQKVVKQ